MRKMALSQGMNPSFRILITTMLWPGWSQAKLTLLLWLREIWPGLCYLPPRDTLVTRRKLVEAKLGGLASQNHFCIAATMAAA